MLRTATSFHMMPPLALICLTIIVCIVLYKTRSDGVERVRDELFKRLDLVIEQLDRFQVPPPPPPPPPPASTPSLTPALPGLRDLYLNTVRDAITGMAFRTTERAFDPGPNNDRFYNTSLGSLARMSVQRRAVGGDWPVFGLTMIGNGRMDNIRMLIERANREGITGDFMECGVWRGGGSMFARAVIATSDVKRDVWLADSFEGLPTPRNPTASGDGTFWSQMSYLRVSLEEVRTNFEAFGLMDPTTVHFCKGFFVNSLPVCRPERIAVLRMDGDMYESTMDQLFNLFPRISMGGFIIIDDWTIDPCRRAMNDFWSWHGLKVTPVPIDGNSVYWQKQADPPLKLDRYLRLKPK